MNLLLRKKETLRLSFPFKYLLIQHQFISLLSFSGNKKKLIKPFIHSEKRITHFKQSDYFNLVLDVNKYEKFLPFCKKSQILDSTGLQDNQLLAELTIGFKFISEKYISIVSWTAPHTIHVAAANSKIFSKLINSWRFMRGPQPNTTLIEFNVLFQFENYFYQEVAAFFFEEVVKTMVNKFDERAKFLYGKPTLELRKGGEREQYFPSFGGIEKKSSSKINELGIDTRISHNNDHYDEKNDFDNPIIWIKAFKKIHTLEKCGLLFPEEAKSARKLILEKDRSIMILYRAIFEDTSSVRSKSGLSDSVERTETDHIKELDAEPEKKRLDIPVIAKENIITHYAGDHLENENDTAFIKYLREVINLVSQHEV